MRKEELRKLRSLPATEAIKREGRVQVERSSGWGTWQHKYTTSKWKTLIRAQYLSGIIKVAIFIPDDITKKIYTPRYELFINPKGYEFITRELDDKGKEVRWLTAMVQNLPGVYPYESYYGSREAAIYLTQDTYRTFNTLLTPLDDAESKLKDTYRGVDRLRKWQQMIRDEDIRQKEAREIKPWDEDMALVPELPKSFDEWMKYSVCKNVFIFYEYKASGAKEGYCSRCKTVVPIKEPRHDKKTTCPHCKAKALFKASGKIRTLSTESYTAQIIQKIKGGIVIRKIDQQQLYGSKGYMHPYARNSEWERIIITDDNAVRRYVYGLYKNKCHRWILDNSAAYYYRKDVKLYKRNWKAVCNTEVFRHSAIGLWDELPTDVTSYLQIEKGNPAVEMLARIGMFKLAAGLIRARYDHNLLKEDATEIAKILRIDNARLKRLKNMDADVKHLRWMQLEKLANTIWPDEMIDGLAQAGITPSMLNFLNPPIAYPKAYRYLAKQSTIAGVSMYDVIGTWQDYLNMADQMKMNTKLEQIEFPKDVKAAHDELVLLRESAGIKKQAAELRKKWPKAEKHLKALTKFEYKDEKYQIVTPKSLDDIVKEGIILHHCVHTCDYYFSRIQSDESYLFFLRKASNPDMPWYTLEVEPSGNIRQKRTTGDNQNKDFEDAIGFLKKWQNYFSKKLTKKEKELGVISDKLRKENYSNLRKNQNKVWHGKLAGQLLADVLEADFMAAVGQ